MQVSKFIQFIITIAQVLGAGAVATNALADEIGVSKPSWSREGSHLTYESFRNEVVDDVYDSDSWLAVAGADGSNPHPILAARRLRGNNYLTGWSNPDWSALTNKIAFESGDGGVWIAKADGTDLKKVTLQGGDPSWSPDGSKMVVEYQDDLYVVPSNAQNIDLSREPLPQNVKQITENFNARADEPAWQPGNDRILFTSDFGRTLFSVKSNGQGISEIAKERPSGYKYEYPTWSPDGRQIAYQSNYDVYKVTVTANNAQQTTNSEQLVYTSSMEPDWSTRNEIAVTRLVGCNSGDSTSAIIVIRPDGSGEREVVRPAACAPLAPPNPEPPNPEPPKTCSRGYAIQLSGRRAVKISQLASKHGVRLVALANFDARARASLSLSKRFASRLGMRPKGSGQRIQLAVGTVTLRSGKEISMQLKLGKKLRVQLKRKLRRFPKQRVITSQVNLTTKVDAGKLGLKATLKTRRKLGKKERRAKLYARASKVVAFRC